MIMMYATEIESPGINGKTHVSGIVLRGGLNTIDLAKYESLKNVRPFPELGDIVMYRIASGVCMLLYDYGVATVAAAFSSSTEMSDDLMYEFVRATGSEEEFEIPPEFLDGHMIAEERIITDAVTSMAAKGE